MASILVLNGPNLNLLGLREPETYGYATLHDVESMIKESGSSQGHAVTCLQSNHEGALVDAIHESHGTHDGIILNAGAYTHTSIALRDAISGVALPVVEVHISNVYAREPFRHKSMIASVCIGVVAGFGTRSYGVALTALTEHLQEHGA